jgi:hypothetical protein
MSTTAELSADRPFVEAWRDFIQANPHLGLADTASAAEGFRRRHGDSLIEAGVLYRAVTGRWCSTADFDQTALYVCTAGRHGTDPATLIAKAQPQAEA